MSEVSLIGYSERGVLYSLLYEIGLANNGGELLGALIEEMTFPFTKDKPPTGNLTVYVEPSFSRYLGDSDAVFLIESDKEICAIFIEAKVGESERLHKKFDKFIAGSTKNYDGHSSTIFMQLYHKRLLIKYDIDNLKTGIHTLEWSKPKERRLGAHSVVHATVEQIKTCGDNAFYLMLVPDCDKQAGDFFEEVLKKQDAEIKSKIPEWDTTYFGFLTWETVEKFCGDNKLKNTLAVFKHNGEQIYKKNK